MPLFMSRVIGQPVVTALGSRRGVVRDLVISLGRPGYPPVEAVVVRDRGREQRVAASKIATLDERGVVLRGVPLPEVLFPRRAGEVLVRDDLLDRRVIDVRAGRVPVVFDAAFDVLAGQVRLVGVDVGVWGIVRRLLPRRPVGQLAGELLDWSAVELLTSTRPWAPLHVTHNKLATLPSLVLATIVEDLPFPQAAEAIAALDDETAARVLERIAPERRVGVLLVLPPAQAAAILDATDPTTVASVLGKLPRAHVADLLLAAAGLATSRRVPPPSHHGAP